AGATRLAAQAKRLATDTGFDVVNGCLQLHGGYGYLRDHPIQRVLRDLRVHQILEGSNEILRLIVGRGLVGREEAPCLRGCARSRRRRCSQAPPSTSASPSSRRGSL